MTVPFQFQTEAVKQVEAWDGKALLAHEMGLGKSFMSLLYLQRNREDCLPAVIVCPASLKWNWERECKVHIGLRAEVLEGTKPPKWGFPRKRDLIVLNYDILKFWLEPLLALRPKLIILDEVQMISNRGSQRAKAARVLCRQAPHRLALSGTPLTNRPSELWSVLNMLRPDKWPAFWPYAMEFCAPKRSFWGWDFSGASNLDRLHKTLRETVMVRKLKSEVLEQLPEKTRSIVPVRIDLSEYEDARDDYLGWIARRNPDKLAGIEKAEQLGRLNAMRQIVGKAKLPAVMDWVDRFLESSDGKLILFTIHRKIVKELEDRYGNACVMVNGAVTGRKRRMAVESFQKRKQTRLFIGNIKAAGVGLNLTAAHDVAFGEYGWTPGEHIQAEDRCYARLNDVHGAAVNYLTARGTMEEWMVKLIWRKQGNLNRILDDGKGESLDVMKGITKHLMKETKK